MARTTTSIMSCHDCVLSQPCYVAAVALKNEIALSGVLDKSMIDLIFRMISST